MYVCHCRAVTDRGVRAAVDGGAHNPAEIARRCGAGTGCGGCLPALRAMLAELDLATDRPRRVLDEHAA